MTDALRRGRKMPAAGMRMPALTALLIQCVALIIVFLLSAGFRQWFGWASVQMPGSLSFALLQGTIAAILSRWRKQAPWWWAIQFIFPCALVATQALQLPPWIFLSAFLFLLVLYWSTFRTQVPFYPSLPVTWRAVAELLPSGHLRCIDIGSGLGGLVMHLAARRPDSEFTGIELAPLPWLISLLHSRIIGSAAHFVRGDYENLNLADYDAIFAYLSPAAMPALWTKARSEMRGGSLLLSYEFAIPGFPPDIVCAPQPDGPMLYGWRM